MKSYLPEEVASDCSKFGSNGFPFRRMYFFHEETYNLTYFDIWVEENIINSFIHGNMSTLREYFYVLIESITNSW